jgi:hypothetical protein
MKSKIRNITVLNKHFVWNVKMISANFICLRIWIKGNKRIPWIQARYRFDDPWIHYGEIITMKNNPNSVFQLRSITPETVKKIICNAIENDKISYEFKNTYNFELLNGNLLKISNALEPGVNPFN